MNTKVSNQARVRITEAITHLDRAIDLLSDADDLERHLAGATSGIVESSGDAKQGTFRIFEGREMLLRALSAQAVATSTRRAR